MYCDDMPTQIIPVTVIEIVQLLSAMIVTMMMNKMLNVYIFREKLGLTLIEV